MQCFLLVILMVNPIFGGLMEMKRLKAGNLKICLLPLVLILAKKPSCIDLIVTGQPYIILDSGTPPSLDTFCHHQIIYCKVNFRIPPPAPFERKIWHFNRANTAAIKRSMTCFPWILNTDPSWQVKIFTDILLNIMSNFVPNEI